MRRRELDRLYDLLSIALEEVTDRSDQEAFEEALAVVGDARRNGGLG